VAIKLIHGTDEYLMNHHARKAVHAFCPEAEQTLGLEIVNGTVKTVDEAVVALKTCLGGLRTVGLFGGQKTVWLRDVSIFKDKILQKNKDVKALLGELAEDLKRGLPDGHHLVISTLSVDRRSVFYKTCVEVAEVEVYDLPEQDYKKRPLVRERAQNLFAKAGCRVQGDALDVFLEKVGLDTRLMVMEAEKLILYMGQGREITTDDVKAITSSSAEAILWDFTDALGERRLDESLKILRQLIFQGESPVGILFSMENLFQNLVQFRAYIDQKWLSIGGGYGAQAIRWSTDSGMQDLFDHLPTDPRKMHWFRTSKIGQQAKNYTAKELAIARQRLLKTHEQLLSSAVPKEILLEMLVIKLITQVQK